MPPLYGAVAPPPAARAVDGPADTAVTRDWLSKVYCVFGLQVSFVSCVSLFFMLHQDVHNRIQNMNEPAFWIPMVAVQLVTLLMLHNFYDSEPSNIYAQFAYLLTWGFALAVVGCSYYPGCGALIIPGVLFMGVGFLALAVLARCTVVWGHHAIAIAALTSVPFEVVAWRHAYLQENDDVPAVVNIALCNLFMVLVEIYLVWKTEKSFEAHGTDQIWTTTSDLLLASFGVPCVFPLQVVVLNLGWNCCGSRYLEQKKKREQEGGFP